MQNIASFKQIENLFHEAIAIADPQERNLYLEKTCGDDPTVLQAVERLIRAHHVAGNAATNCFVHDQTPIANSMLDYAGIETEIKRLLGAPDGSDGSGLGTLLHFDILKVIGRGGAGVVVKARDTKLGRIVALKMILPRLSWDSTSVERLMREARAAASISHDHVIAIHAVHATENPPFICMEYVEGCSLQERIEQFGPLEIDEILRLGIQIADGLEAAHRLGIIHRDIKPANVLLENGLTRAKITDFGLAHATDDIRLTATGQLAGTPQYMSPEQANGTKLDARTDLFSLGAVLYFMCTAKTAFRGESAPEVLRRINSERPLGIQELNQTIPKWFERIVGKLLEKDPQDRFQTAEEVARALRQGLDHLRDPVTTPAPEFGANKIRRVPILVTPALRINPLALFVLLEVFVVGAMPAIIALQDTLFGTAFLSIIVIPTIGSLGVIHCLLAWRWNKSMTVKAFGVSNVCLCATFFLATAFGLLPNNGSMVRQLQLCLLAYQLVSIPIGVASLLEIIPHANKPMMKSTFTVRDLFIAIFYFAIALATVRIIATAWSGYSVEVATSVFAITVITSLAVFATLHLKKVVMGQWPNLPRKQLILAMTVLAILASSAISVAWWNGGRFGELRLKFTNLPTKPITTIQKGYDRIPVLSDQTRNASTYRLRQGEYRLVVTSPNYLPKPEFIDLQFHINGTASTTMEIDCNDYPRR